MKRNVSQIIIGCSLSHHNTSELQCK